MMNDKLHRTHVITLFHQCSAIQAREFALFPFAFESNTNLFLNTITDRISFAPLPPPPLKTRKEQINKQTNKTKEK